MQEYFLGIDATAPHVHSNAIHHSHRHTPEVHEVEVTPAPEKGAA